MTLATTALSAFRRRPLSSVRSILAVVHNFAESGPMLVFFHFLLGNSFASLGSENLSRYR